MEFIDKLTYLTVGGNRYRDSMKIKMNKTKLMF